MKLPPCSTKASSTENSSPGATVHPKTLVPRPSREISSSVEPSFVTRALLLCRSRGLPELLGCAFGPFGERPQLRPLGPRLYPSDPSRLGETTVRACHDPLAPDDVREADEPLRDELGSLDHLGLVCDDAGDE